MKKDLLVEAGFVEGFIIVIVIGRGDFAGVISLKVVAK